MPTLHHFRPAMWIMVAMLLCSPAKAQRGQVASTDIPEVGSIIVTVTVASGASVNSIVSVNLYKQTHELLTSMTVNNTMARFDSVPLGHYIAEAEAPGFEDARANVDLERRGDKVSVSLTLQPSSDPNARPVAPGPPLLAPKVQKELHAGLEALRAGKLEEARKQLTAAGQHAPNHPGVNYLLGLLAQETGDPAAAKVYWEKALSQWPNHLFSLLALADLLLNQGDLHASQGFVDRALATDASSGRAHFLSARVNLQAGIFENAAKEAQQAIDLDKEDALAAQLILAKSQVGLHQPEKAVTTLEALLKAGPSKTQAAAAQRMLEALNKPSAERDSAPPQGRTQAALTLADTGKSTSTPFLPPPAPWMPTDVDEKIPPVETGVVCPLDQVLAGAGKRVVEFTKAVDHFSATELLEHQVIDSRGIAVSSEDRKFNYLVSIQEVRPGYLNVDEYRDGSLGYDMFPDHLATVGLPSIVLMFHPVNVADYDMTCEGLGNWQGTPAWQVHFRHSDVTRSPIRTYKVGGHIYPVPLKGRAWISASNSQVLRIETDLRNPVPEIKLIAEHQSLDYGPVKFKNRDVQLWLPAETDIYFDYKGKRVHRRHSFSDFLLFSVEDKQKIGKPKETEAPAPVTGAANPSS